MLYFSFGNLAFNGKSSESMIDMVISGKSKFDNAEAFWVDAIRYMDEEIYPGEGIKEEYNGAYLKEGLYKDIVMQWIASMNEKVEISFDDIQKTHRIKLDHYDPMRDEFVLETADEFIMFSWSTSA